jgi:hypothetical protein
LTPDVINACALVARETILLLRLNYLEGVERAEFWRRCAPDVYVLPNRPSFHGGGTDATAYAWFRIRNRVPRGEGTVRVLAPVPAAQRRAKDD